MTSTSVPQAGGSREDSAFQAASASSPKQLVRQSVLPRQAVPWKTVLLRQLVPLPPKQLTLRQLALTLPRQRVLILRWSAPLSSSQLIPKKTALPRQPAPPSPKQLVLRLSALPRLLVSGKIALLRQPPLLLHKQLVLRQSALPRPVSAHPQVVSTSASQAGSPWEDSASQAAITSSHTHRQH